MWKNKHVVVAMLVAPVLAILAWFLVDYLVAEKPQAARAGASYPLVARSNCRYESGRCDLDNNDFRLTLEAEGSAIKLTSRFPLTSATAGLGATPMLADEPQPFTAADQSGTVWLLDVDAVPGPDDIVRVAVVAEASIYFAEVTGIFLTDAGAARR